MAERYVDGSITEPSWRDDFKLYARIDFDQHDELVSNHLKSAREWFERQTGICTAQRTVTLKLDSFPNGVIELKRAPASSVTSVGYVDSEGNSQTWSSTKYTVDLGDAWHFARIQPVQTEFYPATYDGLADVTVTFVAGYSTIGDMPQRFRDCVFSYAEDLYNGIPSPSDRTSAKLAACGGWQYA